MLEIPRQLKITKGRPNRLLSWQKYKLEKVTHTCIHIWGIDLLYTQSCGVHAQLWDSPLGQVTGMLVEEYVWYESDPTTIYLTIFKRSQKNIQICLLLQAQPKMKIQRMMSVGTAEMLSQGPAGVQRPELKASRSEDKPDMPRQPSRLSSHQTVSCSVLSLTCHYHLSSHQTELLCVVFDMSFSSV